MMPSLFNFLNSVAVKLLLTLLTGAILVGLVVDRLYPLVMPIFFEKTAVQCAKDASRGAVTARSVLKTINNRNLAWLFIIETSGKVLPATSAFVPSLEQVAGGESGTVQWDGADFYEAIVPVKDGQMHVGFRLGPFFTVGNILNSTTGVPACPLPWILLYLSGLTAFTVYSMNMAVSAPLRKLALGCDNLLDTSDGPKDHHLNLSIFAASEARRLSESLRGIRAKFDKDVYTRLSREHELKKQQQELEKEKLTVKKEFDEHIVQTQRSISELHTKETEEEFLNALSREIDTMSSLSRITQRILERLNDKFPNSITRGCFLITGKKDKLRIESSLGLDESEIAIIDEEMQSTMICEKLFHTGKQLTLEENSFAEYGLTNLAKSFGMTTAYMLPLTFNNKNLGLLSIFYTGDRKVATERQRILRNIGELSSRSLYRVSVYQEEIEAARTDSLTGLYNKKFFYEIVPQLFEKIKNNPEEHPISFLMLDGDHFKAVNDTYGHQTGDLVLKELAKSLQELTRTREYGVRTGRPTDYIVRYGGEELLVIMEDTGAVAAAAVGERIRKSLDTKTDWPGGLPHWTVSIGVSTYPSHAKNMDELLLQADQALYYVKEELGRNKVCHFATVPKSFGAKKYSYINGELGIFDPSALLQSIATASKTGVLTVQGKDQRKVWMMYENGRPMQARLGKFTGRAAIVEFITTFEEGNFNFQEMQPNALELSQKLRPTAANLDVGRGLERCLMDAALASDNFAAAKKVVRNTDVHIRLAHDFMAKMTALKDNTATVSPEELNTMKAILNQNDDSALLSDIFKDLDHIPTAELWRAAALLLETGLVTFEAPAAHGMSTLKLHRMEKDAPEIRDKAGLS